jgi:ABC-type transport system involved in cytochrome c biogenesis permease subunit
MSDVSFFWFAFVAYLAAMFVLGMAALRPGGERLGRVGRLLVWLGLGCQTASLVWRAFRLGTSAPERFFERLQAAFSEGPGWQATVYVLLFVVAALALAVGVVLRRRRVAWLVAAGVAVLLELVLLDFLDFTRVPIEKPYEYLLLASWCAGLALLALSPVLRLPAVDAALAVAASLLAVFAAIQPKTIELQLVPALQSYWLFIHVSLTSIAYAVFGIAFVVAALFLVRAYDPSASPRPPLRRVCVAGAVAKGLALALVLALVLGAGVLPFAKVAYTPREQAMETLPPARAIQYVRYGGALLGAFYTVAFVLFWPAYALVRPRADRSGTGSYLFVVTSIAVFAASLALGGFVRRQERAIREVTEEKWQLDRLVGDLPKDEEATLTQAALEADIEHWRALAAQARSILSQARWLPLTHEKQAKLADEPLFQSLQELYEETGVAWRLPIRYKDIKEIGREMGRRAEKTEAVGARLDLPARREQLLRVRRRLQEEAQARESKALMPRDHVGKLAVFVGVAFLLAAPLMLLLYRVLPRVRRRLPEAKRLDNVSYGAIAIGYPLFTFGALFAGAIWAHFAWGAWWSWDPKEVGSLVAWVLYTVYLHQRYREGLSPRTAAVAAMLGFLAATLSLAGNAFTGGLHAYS